MKIYQNNQIEINIILYAKKNLKYFSWSIK